MHNENYDLNQIILYWNGESNKYDKLYFFLQSITLLLLDRPDQSHMLQLFH